MFEVLSTVLAAKTLETKRGIGAFKVESHAAAGRNVVYTDAEDANFWHGIDLSGVQAVVLAMDALESKLIAARQLRARDFGGAIVAHALHEDEVRAVVAAGASETYLTMYEAGIGLAEHTWKALDAPDVSPAVQEWMPSTVCWILQVGPQSDGSVARACRVKTRPTDFPEHIEIH